MVHGGEFFLLHQTRSSYIFQTQNDFLITWLNLADSVRLHFILMIDLKEDKHHQGYLHELELIFAF